MKRRDFLKTGLAAGMGTMLPFRGRIRDQKTGIGKAGNIIFFVYDGFTWEDFSSAQHFVQRNHGKTLHLNRLFRQGSGGSMQTHSLTSMVTDSAAATSAWATGRKIVNGSLSVYPDGRELTTILELAKAKGKATGVVTTTRITHATPAGWIARHPNRRAEEEIAKQFFDFGADVMIGGGSQMFSADQREDGVDLFGQFRQEGYTVIQEKEELASVSGSKLLATLNRSHIPFEIDRRFQGTEAPTLAEMVEKGIEILDGSERGFVLQVEAGRIDHANHRVDAAASLWETIAADEALGVIMEYTDRTPGTLLIMASDHGTGGASVYGVGERYRSSSEIHDLLTNRKASFSWILNQLGNSPDEQRVREVIEALTGVSPTADGVTLLQKALEGDYRMPDLAAYPRQPYPTLGWILKGGTNEDPSYLNINFGTTQHTAGAVPAAMYSNGVELIPIGLVDNTDAYSWMTEALDIDYENPL